MELSSVAVIIGSSSKDRFQDHGVPMENQVIVHFKLYIIYNCAVAIRLPLE